MTATASATKKKKNKAKPATATATTPTTLNDLVQVGRKKHAKDDERKQLLLLF